MDLDHTRITEAGLLALAELPLTRLDISHTAVRTRGLEVLRDNTELTWLELGYSNITGRGMASIAKLTKLEHLGLAFVGAGADAMAVVARNPIFACSI